MSNSDQKTTPRQLTRCERGRVACTLVIETENFNQPLNEARLHYEDFRRNYADKKYAEYRASRIDIH